MKKIATMVALLITIAATQVFAQSSVHPKDLKGVWHMTFDLTDEAESEAERIALGAVEGLLDWIDIRVEFLPDNRLKVMVHVFGEDEVEYAEWQVNDRRELVLGKTDHFDSEDTVWLFNDGKLTAYEYSDGERVRSSDGVYLEMES